MAGDNYKYLGIPLNKWFNPVEDWRGTTAFPLGYKENGINFSFLTKYPNFMNFDPDYSGIKNAFKGGAINMNNLLPIGFLPIAREKFIASNDNNSSNTGVDKIYTVKYQGSGNINNFGTLRIYQGSPLTSLTLIYEEVCPNVIMLLLQGAGGGGYRGTGTGNGGAGGPALIYQILMPYETTTETTMFGIVLGKPGSNTSGGQDANPTKLVDWSVEEDIINLYSPGAASALPFSSGYFETNMTYPWLKTMMTSDINGTSKIEGICGGARGIKDTSNGGLPTISVGEEPSATTIKQVFVSRASANEYYILGSGLRVGGVSSPGYGGGGASLLANGQDYSPNSRPSGYGFGGAGSATLYNQNWGGPSAFIIYW